jgi:hypothetical protein
MNDYLALVLARELMSQQMDCDASRPRAGDCLPTRRGHPIRARLAGVLRSLANRIEPAFAESRSRSLHTLTRR